jgi:hypothetical protein
VDVFDVKYQDSVRRVTFQASINPDPSLININSWETRWNDTDMNALIQPYAQVKYKASKKLTLTGGVTSLYYSINKKSFSAIEPRIGVAYNITNKQKISFGLGVHSQIQSNYLYYYGNDLGGGNIDTYNKDVGLTKNNHAVLGYDITLGHSAKLKMETYYQYLTNIPVEIATSGFSLINSGSGFSRFFPNELENTGTGRNYGIELTLEKSFSNAYYFLVTTSLYDSKYKGSDDIWRNTAFNGNHTINALFAKEFKFKKSSLNIGGKITTAGGRRYGDVDVPATIANQDIVYKNNENLNVYKFKPYFRTDMKVNYRINAKKLTHEFAIDFVNIFNTKNILTLTYVPDESVNFTREDYQLGFLPLFYYRVDF